MKVNAGSARAGHVIELDGKVFKIVKHEIVTPGKGRALIHFELRDLMTGRKDVSRHFTDETIERATLEQHKAQFLYEADEKYHFMNNETFAQFEIDLETIGEDFAPFLQDGMTVELEMHDERVIGVTLPSTVILEVVETEPVIKGQTVSSSYKPATMDNGVRVMVPPFVDTGTRIVVKTEDCSYVERAKD
ncbi:MAG: elongation factor P [Micavibrio sp.]|nr:elongation factor P [Micavibrio sp.]|tara:strand:+ start:5071 stop:5640 length:570 start_codon:yes stop_codon:yes gene_type:complete